MATLEVKAPAHEGHPTVFVDTFTNGVLGPCQEMLGPVADGGHIVVNTAPGCWGPMITPRAARRARGGPAGGGRGREGGRRDRHPDQGHRGHLDGHGLGQRLASSTGRYNGDPYCAKQCGELRHAVSRQSRLEGIGQYAVRCANCGADATPFKFTNGYTIAFDEGRRLGVTLQQAAAEEIAARRRPLRRAAGELRPASDPRVRPARPRRRRRPPAPVHGPARHLAVRGHAGLPQRGRLRLVPDRRAARFRDDRLRTSSSTRPTATSTWRPRARARSSSAPSSSTAAASTWATCTRCRATARSPATRATCRARSPCRSRCSRA